MELANEFSVAAPVDQAWAALLDVERIAPCMPGAELTSFDGENFTGTVKVKLGPVNLTYAGRGKFLERDSDAHRVVIQASGKDKRGTATAAATVTGTLHAEGDGTRVKVVTDLRVTGAPAQFGRGMIADVAGKLIGQFADCLATTMAEQPAATDAALITAPPAAAALAEPGIALTEPLADEPSTAVAEPTPGTADVAEPSGAAPATTVAEAPTTEPQVEPIDLLAVTGVSGAVKRAVPYVVAFLAGAAVGAIVAVLVK